MNDNLPSQLEYKKYKYKLTPFKLCVLENFPFIEADFDAITNYQLLCKVVEYLNRVIDNQNTVEDNFKIMKENLDYLYNFFDNLDISDEVNNKLDKMAEDGTLAELFGENLVYSSIDMFFPDETAITGDLSCLKCKFINDEKNIIIDFGNADYSYSLLKQKLLNKGYNKFDYAFITHYHLDHIGHLESILNDTDFDFSDCVFYLPPTPNYNLFVGSTRYVPEKESEVITLLTAKNISYIQATNSTVLDIFHDIHFKFLNCNYTDFSSYYNSLVYYSDVGTDCTNYNNFSMVLQIKHGNQSLLFTGDIEKEAQDVVITQGLEIPTFLKMEHHAVDQLSRYSSNYINNFYKAKINVAMSATAGIRPIRSFCKDSEMFITRSNGDISVFSSGYNLYANSTNGVYNPSYTEEVYNTTHGITGFLNLSNPLSINYINENDNLDNYLTAGTYCSPSESVTASITNAPPFSNGFKLIVMNNVNLNRTIQYAIQNTTAHIYFRTANTENEVTTFSNWNIIHTSENSSIDANTDLNNLPIGDYYSPSGDITTTLTNVPSNIESRSFKLLVTKLLSSNDRLIQIIFVNSAYDEIYYRIKTENNVWTSWTPIDNYKNITIANNTDLDNIPVGNYSAPTGAVAGSLLHAPVTTGFYLECRYVTNNTSERLYQMVIPNKTIFEQYYRIKSSNGWSNWYKVTATEIV